MWGAQVLGDAIMEMENVISDGDTKSLLRLWAGEPLSLLDMQHLEQVFPCLVHLPLPRIPSHPQNTSRSNRSVVDSKIK